MEVNNIFMTYNCNTNDAQNVLIVKNCLGRDCLHFIQTLTKQEVCKTFDGQFDILTEYLSHSTMKLSYLCNTASDVDRQ